MLLTCLPVASPFCFHLTTPLEMHSLPLVGFYVTGTNLRVPETGEDLEGQFCPLSAPHASYLMVISLLGQRKCFPVII